MNLKPTTMALVASVALMASGAALAQNTTPSSTPKPTSAAPPPAYGTSQSTSPADIPGTGSASTTAHVATGTEATFKELDKDGDGNVSKSEAARNKDVKKQWAKLDANKDGKLDSAEFAQFEASGDAAASGTQSSKPSSSDRSSSDSMKPKPMPMQ